MKLSAISLGVLALGMGLGACGDNSPGSDDSQDADESSSGGSEGDGDADGSGGGDGDAAGGSEGDGDGDGDGDGPSGGAIGDGDTGGTPGDGDGDGDGAGASGDGDGDGDGAGCSVDALGTAGDFTLDVDGAERAYIVSLPEDYDPTQSYPLVFVFHGLGGSGEGASGRFYIAVEYAGGTPSIFVYPDGSQTDGGLGWPNEGGVDVAFFDAMLERLQADYCVDTERVFATGHSYGGMMSHTLACQRSEVMRAVAPVAGAHFGGGGCGGPVAAWGAHGDPDETVDYESGFSAIQRIMETNGCDADSGQPVEPTENCVSYSCDAGMPVTWCTHDEGHNWPEFAADSVKGFFDSL